MAARGVFKLPVAGLAPIQPIALSVLDLLAKDRMQDFRELADDAFADLLRKHGRPVDLKTALRQSVGEIEKQPAAPSVRAPR